MEDIKSFQICRHRAKSRSVADPEPFSFSIVYSQHEGGAGGEGKLRSLDVMAQSAEEYVLWVSVLSSLLPRQCFAAAEYRSLSGRRSAVTCE